MIKSKYFKVVACIFMACALLFTTLLLIIPKSANSTSTAEYSNLLFDDSKISKINIDLSDNDWQDILENPLKEEYHQADITINGETIYNVGIRSKGNTSLSQVASSDSNRYSFKIKFDEYVNGQSYHGLDKLNLNNIYADATYLKEYLSYDLFKFMGVTSPENSFSNISINNENYGLYLTIEGLETSYLTRNFGSDYGNLYKAEGTGTNLKWTGEDQENYSGLKNNSATNSTDEDFQKIIDMIYNLNNGSNLESHLDIDSIMKYFAVSTALVNLDSYQSNLYHNYYIYEKNGICTILPWDLNLSFGGFPAGMGGGPNKNDNPQDMQNQQKEKSSSASSTIHFPIDEPTSSNLSDSPLLSKLLEVDEYKEIYHKYLKEIVENYFNSDIFKEKLYSTASLIDDYVKNDPTIFFSYEQFKNSIDELYNLGIYRSKSILMQLSGEIPSTKTEQNNVDLDNYFGADVVNMTILGSMNGGKGGDNEDFNKLGPPNMPNNNQISEVDPNNSNNANNPPNDKHAPPDVNDKTMMQMPPEGDFPNTNFPEENTNSKEAKEAFNNTLPNINDSNKNNISQNKMVTTESIILTSISVTILIASLAIVKKFKRKKFTVH